MFGAVKGTMASGPASPAPISVAPSTMPPLAYHSIPSDGSWPLSRSPSCQPGGLTAKCGSGMCGSSNLKLNRFLMVSIAPVTMFTTVSNAPLTAFAMVVKMVCRSLTACPSPDMIPPSSVNAPPSTPVTI